MRAQGKTSERRPEETFARTVPQAQTAAKHLVVGSRSSALGDHIVALLYYELSQPRTAIVTEYECTYYEEPS